MSEPLKLTGPQKGILTEGIVGAYPDPDNLWYLLTVRMEVQASAILQGDTYKAQVFNLIQEFFANGRIGEFIRVVVNHNPNSPALVVVKKEFAGILGNSGGQDTTGAASLDLGEIAKNTDWYTFKEYGKPLEAIASPRDRALKVVFMAAEPRAIEGQVRYEEQERTILEVIYHRPIDINVEESGCLEELQLTLDEYKSDLDILHLAGVYETEDEQGYLITEDEYGNRVNSTAEDVFRAIKKASPRLVILWSSDRYGHRESAATIAEELIGKGLEAVITLDGDKSDTLMTTIYRQLASGNNLEDALRKIHREYQPTLTNSYVGIYLANQQLVSHPLVRTGLTFTPKPVTIRVLDGVGKFKEMTRANFIGRRRQLQNCLYALRNGSKYVGVFLHGGGGLGKSSIASRLSFGRLSNYEMIFWSDWQKGVTPLNSKALIDKLKKTNSIFREPALLSYLNESTEETLETNLRILFDELNQKGKPLLLIFDDFEWNLEPQEDGGYTIKTEPARVLQAVIEAVINTSHKIIITCRYNKFDRDSFILPYFYPQGLEPLAESDLEKLFRRLDNFNSDRVEAKLQEKAKEIAEGNPRLLEELNTVLGKSLTVAQRELEEYEKDPNKKDSIIWRELYEQIKKDTELENVLGCGLVYRIPVPRSFLVEVCGEKEEQIEKGINLGLIEESSEREEENRLYRVSPILPKTISSIHLPVDEQELLLLQRQAYNLLNSLWANKKNRNEERWREIFRLAFADKENPDRFREQFTKMISVQYNAEADRAYEKELRKEKEYLTANQEQIYQKLEEFLKQQDWKKADYETALIVCQWIVIENHDDFYDLFRGVSLKVINEIDRLWMQYSNQQFGIKEQAKIYRYLGGTEKYNEGIWESFGDRVGWKQGGEWLDLDKVAYRTTETQYHLPVLMYYHYRDLGWVVGNLMVGVVCCLFSRVKT
jgi:hypothetical protein